MAASLLGYWPGESTIDVIQVSDREQSTISTGSDIYLPPGRSPDGGADRRHSSSGESDTSHGSFHDAVSTPMMLPQFSACVAGPSQNMRPETELTDDKNVGNADWQKSQPPEELFDVPYGTALELESIIVASVERLQQRLAEEQSFQENAEFARAREQSRPNPEVSGVEISLQTDNDESWTANEVGRVLEMPTSDCEQSQSYSIVMDSIPFSSRDGPRLSDASIATASSGDSGYVSGLADMTAPKGMFFGLFRLGGSLRPNNDKPQTSRQNSVRSGSSTRSVLECVSCLDEFRSKDLVPLTCHSYCKPCFQTLINTATSTESQWPPKCCLNEIPLETILPHLSPKERTKYKETLEERSVPAGERIYCFKASCATWIPLKNIQKDISCAICVSCRQKTCTSCRGIFHATGECPRDANLQATLQVANDEGWRRCFSCSALVEHNQGCIHMTCRCKAQFCYICGSRWRTCTCSDAELQRVLQAATARRGAANAREQEAENRRRMDRAAVAAAEAEAAELREILRQIEVFEIEEAERLAQEAEQLRLAAIESRQRHEEERILAISKRYHDLRNELDFLHALQKVALVERHEEEQRRLRQEHTMRDIMTLQHDTEIQCVEARARAKISDSHFRFDEDYQVRLARERRIEDDYVAELRAYWARRPGGEEKIVEGRDALRKAHADSYRRWEGSKLEAHDHLAEVARAQVSELRGAHEVERAVAAGKIAAMEDRIEAGRRADLKWFERVAEVREEMLEAMQMEEYVIE